MFRNMVTSLFKYEKIQTTGAKAKELRRWADHLITLAKRGDLHARRQALAIVREKDVVHKLFEQAAERFGGVSGGYTRVIKLGHRPGDAAPVSLVELVYARDTKKKKTKKKKAKTVATSKKPAAASKPSADKDQQKSTAPPETATDKIKKTGAKTRDDKSNLEAGSESKEKAAGDAKEEKPAAKAAPKKKASTKARPAEKTKEATAQADAADEKKKKAPAQKTTKDEK
jgi:large subunit ribosomal protein L17